MSNELVRKDIPNAVKKSLQSHYRLILLIFLLAVVLFGFIAGPFDAILSSVYLGII